MELGETPGPYIATAAAAVTKNAEDIDLDADIATEMARTNEGTIECEVRIANIDSATK